MIKSEIKKVSVAAGACPKGQLFELLEELNLNMTSKNPHGTDKGGPKNYIRGFYESEFGGRKSTNNRLLEVGVRSGASLALWANFFKHAKIIGVDVEPIGALAGPLKKYVDYPSVTFFCKDAYGEEFASSLNGSFTIMIDDGPHSLSSQKRFLELYLSKLDKDGVLIIEDVQRAYRDSFQLMRMLAGNRFVFEIYDFRSQSGTGDDFLFVVRHNKSGKSYVSRKVYLTARCLLSWLLVPVRRIKPFLIRLWSKN